MITSAALALAALWNPVVSAYASAMATASQNATGYRSARISLMPYTTAEHEDEASRTAAHRAVRDADRDAGPDLGAGHHADHQRQGEPPGDVAEQRCG